MSRTHATLRSARIRAEGPAVCVAQGKCGERPASQTSLGSVDEPCVVVDQLSPVFGLKAQPFASAAILLALIIGCGPTEPRDPTAKVNVTVTYKGAPVEGALVTFTILQTPPPAYGTTDAQGKASLTTYVAGDGAIIGNHSVMVMKQEFDNTPVAADQETEAYDPTQGSPVPKVKDLIPKKYGSSITSDLKAEVVAGKVNEFTFDLQDK